MDSAVQRPRPAIRGTGGFKRELNSAKTAVLGGVKLEEIRLRRPLRLSRKAPPWHRACSRCWTTSPRILDDVSLLAKVAAKKTAGVLGDDLALNAQQVAGVQADRELPVVWAVARGSFVNKAILVPAALAISAFAPWAVTPLLMVGGAFLCYEGFEKLAHKLLHSRAWDDAHRQELARALANPDVDLRALEKDKIKGAVRTDFILSAEIIAITLARWRTASSRCSWRCSAALPW